VSKTFRPYSPGQSFLLPPSPLEWLPEGHLARFILDLVKELDLTKIYAHITSGSCGGTHHITRC
jgi:hypothetical protein